MLSKDTNTLLLDFISNPIKDKFIKPNGTYENIYYPNIGKFSIHQLFIIKYHVVIYITNYPQVVYQQIQT